MGFLSPSPSPSSCWGVHLRGGCCRQHRLPLSRGFAFPASPGPLSRSRCREGDGRRRGEQWGCCPWCLPPSGIPPAPAWEGRRSSHRMRSCGASLHPSPGATRSTHPSLWGPGAWSGGPQGCPGGGGGDLQVPFPALCRGDATLAPSPGSGNTGGMLHPPPRAPHTSLPLPGARKPEPPEQLSGVRPASTTPPPTLSGARGPPKPLGAMQRAAPLFALSQLLRQVRSELGAAGGGGGHGGGEAPSPLHPCRGGIPAPKGARLGAALPREPVQRVNPPARQVGTWEDRAGCGRSPGWREQVAGDGVQPSGHGYPGAGTPTPQPRSPHFFFPCGAVPQPGLGTGHAALGGGFGGLQDVAGEPGAAGGPAAIQHFPPAAGGSGGRGWR